MQKISSLFIENINSLPIWVKQVITKEVSLNLISKLGEFIELVGTENLFQYMRPKATPKGEQEVQDKIYRLSDSYYLFLTSALNNETIFEITLKNNWSLADSAKILCKLVELEMIEISEDNSKEYAVAQFIANKIRTGEFLKKIGKINALQLNEAIKYQKDVQSEGRNVKMASVLIKMGFITDKGLDSLLLLKDEAKRRLTVSMGFTSIKYNNEADKKDYVLALQKEIARLESENLIMKKRLKKILKIND